MATTRASARKSRAASGQIVPANKTAKDIWLPALKIGGTTAVYISTRERDFKPITRIIADRDTGTHADSRSATFIRASRDQQLIVSEVVFVSRRSGTPIA